MAIAKFGLKTQVQLASALLKEKRIGYEFSLMSKYMYLAGEYRKTVEKAYRERLKKFDDSIVIHDDWTTTIREYDSFKIKLVIELSSTNEQEESSEIARFR